LDVILRPWGFPRQRNSIAADPLTANAETLGHAGLELSGLLSSRHTSALKGCQRERRGSTSCREQVTRMCERLLGMSASRPTPTIA
jgi:hypothetical protein